MPLASQWTSVSSTVGCQVVNHPEEVAASGGMYAGDLILEIFIGCMLLVPTFFPALVIRNSEVLYTRDSLILLGLSLTAPLSPGVLRIPAVSQGDDASKMDLPGPALRLALGDSRIGVQPSAGPL